MLLSAGKASRPMRLLTSYGTHPLRPKKKDSCVQVSEVRKIRVGRSKNIFILDFFFFTNVQRL